MRVYTCAHMSLIKTFFGIVVPFSGGSSSGSVWVQLTLFLSDNPVLGSGRGEWGPSTRGLLRNSSLPDDSVLLCCQEAGVGTLPLCTAPQLALRHHVGCPSGLELEAWTLIACAGFPGSLPGASVALLGWFHPSWEARGGGRERNAVLIKSPKTWRPL